MGRTYCEHGYPEEEDRSGKPRCPKCFALMEVFSDRREQRRYEIARDMMAALALADFGHHDAEERESDEVLAKWSVEAADALLKALEESSDG